MRLLLAFTVVGVFGAMLLIDTAALFRVAAFCVAGGCGVPAWSLTIAIAGIAIGLWLLTRSKTSAVPSRVSKRKAAVNPPRSGSKPAARKKARVAKAKIPA